MEYLLNKLKNEDLSNKAYIIGIDGLGGSGKSTLVNSLKSQLQSEDYYCSVLHLDDFIHPKNIRYDMSREEWDCYYNVQWRYDYLVKEILSPIKNGEIVDKHIEIYNRDEDGYINQNIYIPNGSVLILEGVFLQRKELKGYLDFTVYLDVPQEVRFHRILARDVYIGGFEDIKCKYEKRYFPAEDRYVLDYSPIENANFVLKNIYEQETEYLQKNY
jgi:uridine kinase